jgi:hypothetical protein
MNNSSKKMKQTNCGCGSNKNSLLSLEEDAYKHTNTNNNRDECKLLKQVYGHYNTNKMSNMYFPYKLDLDKWCSKKKPCAHPFDYHYNNDDIIEKNNTPDKTHKHCKTGLCRNPKPLFI